MKKVYAKPLIEIEAYQLDAAIAANCGTKVNLGPEWPGKDICDEYKDAFGGGEDEWTGFSLLSEKRPFYADNTANCDCYYTSGGANYFTS